MINEKEYAKVIAVNLRNIMYERHLTQADLAGVEPALNDDVMRSNAKLCQVPCQNG